MTSKRFPDLDNFDGVSRYIRGLNASGDLSYQCARHLLVRALRKYGGNRVGSM